MTNQRIEINKNERSNPTQSIRYLLRNSIYNNTKDLEIGILYISYEMKKNSILNKHDFLEFAENNIDDDCREFVKDLISKDGIFDFTKCLIDNFTEDELQNSIYNLDSEYYGLNNSIPETSNSIISLANKIFKLDKCENKKIADFGCGYGNYLLHCNELNDSNIYSGIDIDASAKAITKIRFNLLNKKVNVFQNTLFDTKWEDKFDYIFCEPPFGIRGIENQSIHDTLIKLDSSLKNINVLRISEWVYASSMINHLEKDGKAICIMTSSCLFSKNPSEKKLRKFFIENGLIETVILLPNKLLMHTGINVNLVVFSKNNSKIRLIDATKEYVDNIRRNILSEENINNIIKAISEESEISKNFSIDDIINNRYNLDPKSCLTKQIKFENGVLLKDIVKDIKRGTGRTANQLDRIRSNKETHYKYLTLQNIQDGIITDDMQSLKDVEGIDERFFANDGDIILSRQGCPFKVAIVEDTCDKILVSGNMYIITVKQDIVNPYYLKSLLESRIGQQILENNSQGTVINMISLNNLKNITIPLPNLKEQENKVNTSRGYDDEIQILKLKLDAVKEKKYNLYEEVK